MRRMTPMLGLGRTLVKSSGFKASATGWTPANITTALWLDADDASTITLNGSTVSQWRDKSGNAKHASQATLANQPAYTINGLNGKSVLTFDGSNDFLNANLSLSTGTFVIVGKLAVNTGILYYPLGFQSGATTGYFAGGTNQNQKSGLFNGSVILTAPQTVSLNTPFIGAGGFSASGMLVSFNGNAPQTNLATFSMNTLIIGTRGNFSFYFNGEICEVVFTNTTLSTADRQRLEGYLAWKWGLVANLPSGHPYKNSPP